MSLVLQEIAIIYYLFMKLYIAVNCINNSRILKTRTGMNIKGIQNKVYKKGTRFDSRFVIF